MNSQKDELKGKNCMAGYLLKNTLSDHGSVSRGVCKVNVNNELVEITERTKIAWEGSKIIADDNGNNLDLDGETFVSMNFWGFTPDVFPELESEFKKFIQNNLSNIKSEYYIPSIVSHQMNNKLATVKVLEATDQWFGVTYQEDKPLVVAKVKELTDSGKYPEKLW
jgi:hypothetical protein